MPALLMALTLAAAGQDVSTLKISPPPAKASFAQAPSGSPVRCPPPSRGEVVPFAELPAEVLMDLRTIDPTVSPPDGPFNATDMGAGPRMRVIAALRLGGRLAVAYERGGRGYGVTLLTYDADARTGFLNTRGVGPISVRPAFRIEDACAALERALDA